MKRLITTLVTVAAVLGGAGAVAQADDAQAQGKTTQAAGAPSAEQARQILDSTRPLADKGDASAQYNMGVLYDQGYGVKQDFAIARQWYLKAAGQHFAKAEHNLGIIYESGKGVKADPSEAAHWFRRAADDGEPAAQNNLAVMYVRGEGVPQDMGAAAYWAAKAAASGNQSAIDNLPEIVAGLPHSHVNGEHVNVRAESNKKAPVVRQVDSANQLVVLKRKADWTQVMFPDDYVVGWVANFLLADSQAPLAHADQPQAPVTKSPSSDQSGASEAVSHASSASTQGKSVAGSNVADTSADSAATDASDDSVGGSTTRVVAVSVANIRSKPARSAKVAFQAHRGDKVKVSETQNGWAHVRTEDGHTGWVAGFLLNAASD